MASLWIPARPADGHKGTFGRALIIAGSRGFSGAAALAGTAALRGGAGLVFVACPLCVQPIIAGFEPGYVTIGLPDDAAGRLSDASAAELLKHLDGSNAVAIGPGLATGAVVKSLTARLFNELGKPLVVDADGLNVLADEFVSGRLSTDTARAPRVLTPHPGEFSRLTGLSIRDISQRREQVAQEFAARHGVILVLKGAGSVVTDGDRVVINETGNSGMATGGSGDVLTGLTVALAAQTSNGSEADIFEAVRLAVYLHGLAGDLAAAELSEPGMIASDLPRFIPAAWKQLLAGRSETPTETGNEQFPQ
jgi:ADP-dependent NAD(P)H-hydrate dehydratase